MQCRRYKCAQSWLSLSLLFLRRLSLSLMHLLRCEEWLRRYMHLWGGALLLYSIHTTYNYFSATISFFGTLRTLAYITCMLIAATKHSGFITL